MDLHRYYSEITKRFGHIKRARGPFFYTAKGIRITDMYLEAGRAILGWGGANGTTGSGAFTFFKNVISRGLTGSFENDFVPAMDKAAGTLLGKDVKVFVFTSLNSCLEAGRCVSERLKVFVPFAGLVDAGDRGFLYDSKSIKDADFNGLNKDLNFDACIVVPPFAWAGGLYLVCVDCKLETDFEKLYQQSDIINAGTASAVSRSIYDLCKKMNSLSEKDFFVFDKVLCKYFVRKGIYLFPKCSESEYDDFVLWCMDRGYAISPVYDIPSVVPYSADKGAVRLGEEIKWIRV